MSNDINFNAMAEAINDKMDRDGNNASDTFIDEVASRVPHTPTPDWSRNTSLSINTDYTAEEDGFIYGHFGYADGATYTITINGTEVYRRGTAEYADVACFYSLPLAKGDTYKLTGLGSTISFVPYK